MFDLDSFSLLLFLLFPHRSAFNKATVRGDDYRRVFSLPAIPCPFGDKLRSGRPLAVLWDCPCACLHIGLTFSEDHLTFSENQYGDRRQGNTRLRHQARRVRMRTWYGGWLSSATYCWPVVRNVKVAGSGRGIDCSVGHRAASGATFRDRSVTGPGSELMGKYPARPCATRQRETRSATAAMIFHLENFIRVGAEEIQEELEQYDDRENESNQPGPNNEGPTDPATPKRVLKIHHAPRQAEAAKSRQGHNTSIICPGVENRERASWEIRRWAIVRARGSSSTRCTSGTLEHPKLFLEGGTIAFALLQSLCVQSSQ